MGMKLNCYNPKTTQNEIHLMTDFVAAIALCENEHKVLLCLRKTIALYDFRTQQLDPLLAIETDQINNRFNDAKCDPQGRFWPGTMNNINWSSPDGALYCCTSATQCKKIHLHLLRGIAGFGDTNCLFFALSLINLTTTTLLIYSAPLWMLLQTEYLSASLILIDLILSLKNAKKF